jgi:hypothetical protein
MSIARLITAAIILSYSSVVLADKPVEIFPEDTINKDIGENDWHFYKIMIEKPAKLTVKLRRLSDDVDLYVARSNKPDKENYSCAPLKTGKSIETCRLTSDYPGLWYIGIHGKTDGQYQLGVGTKQISQLSLVKN